MKRTILILGILLLSSSCGNEQQQPAPDGPPRTKEEVSQMRMVAGRWRSGVGVLPGQDRRHVILDIANDGSVSMQLRERGPKMDIVLAESSGEVALVEDGISGSLSEPGKDLRFFRSFSAAMPSAGILEVRGSGASIEMTYTGQ